MFDWLRQEGYNVACVSVGTGLAKGRWHYGITVLFGC